MSAHDYLELGRIYPYDEGVPLVDWAHDAARGVIEDLTDRRDIKQGFYNVDVDVRIEIVQSLAEIIRVAYAEGNKPEVKP